MRMLDLILVIDDDIDKVIYQKFPPLNSRAGGHLHVHIYVVL